MTATSTKLKLAATALVVAALAGPGASAYQFGGLGTQGQAARPQADPTKPAATATPSSAEARIRVAQKAIEHLKARDREGTVDPDEILIWRQRLAEAQIDAGMPRAEAVRLYIEAVNEASSRAKSRADAGRGSPVDVLNAEYRRLEAAKSLESHAPAAANPPAPQQVMGGGGMGGEFGAVGGGLVADPDAHPVRPHKTHPADIERNKLIEDRLEKEVVMSFASETPLEEALRYIKESTKDAKGKTIPIYVDPIGLQEAEKTPQSTITLDIEGVPLRTTLRLMLNQLGLDYRVRDGMIYIGSQDTLNQEDEEAENRRRIEEIQARRLNQGGGMGQMGGGMRGGMGGMM